MNAPYLLFTALSLLLGTAHGWAYDHFLNGGPCWPFRGTVDNHVLMHCALLNTDGDPFGGTQKHMEWLQFCPGTDNSYMDDLKLSITNELFGGEGKPGELS